MNQIQQMFALQKQLNDNTNGANWMAGKTKENRQIVWYRCIYMEAAEAIDSFNWKHWKNINDLPDWDNIRVELIDIWHFIMSEAIRINDTKYADKHLNIKANTTADAPALLSILEHILSLSATASIETTKNPIRQIIDLFFAALATIGMNTQDLYQNYVVKNQLNIFRQKHGYKYSSYHKIWMGVEDNVVAFGLMQKQPNLTPDELYQQLTKTYQQVLINENKQQN